ncbi:MAG: Holliday junction resolvase RuvX [Alphaproteobacteria bacterium]|nr:Holliday junction resolvase RuvX [Alphaproteobacteria bacterium]
MPLGLLEKIMSEAPQGKPLLGLDVGRKTIGLAVSNGAQSVATPLRTIMRRKFATDASQIARAVDDYAVGGLVLGYPVNMDGSHSPRCDAVRSFADELMKLPEIAARIGWVAFWDERLSTHTVEGYVDSYVDIRKAKESGLIDKLAAQVILQGALDYMALSRNA